MKSVSHLKYAAENAGEEEEDNGREPESHEEKK
jgi:hypothetical protein